MGVLAASIAAILAIAAAASGEATHTYAVTLTIAVDRSAGEISGTISSEAPAEFCEMSTVRVRAVMPGRDKVVARIFPNLAEWHMKTFPAIRGMRVYAEVSSYHLPQRPVECLGARSRAVTAP